MKSFLVNNASSVGTQTFLGEEGIIHNKEIINDREFKYLGCNNITKINYIKLNKNIGGSGDLMKDFKEP